MPLQKIMNATFVKEVTVTDPDSKGDVSIVIYKDSSSGCMFGIDSCYIEQNFDDDDIIHMTSPYNENISLHLDDA
jgi:hypothetical protein